jgi:hypothetical protein
LVKASDGRVRQGPHCPYVVEHNTLAGLGQGLGFVPQAGIPTNASHNIVADCARPVEIYDQNDQSRSTTTVTGLLGKDLKKIGANDIVVIQFAWPEGRITGWPKTVPA